MTLYILLRERGPKGGRDGERRGRKGKVLENENGQIMCIYEYTTMNTITMYNYNTPIKSKFLKNSFKKTT